MEITILKEIVNMTMFRYTLFQTVFPHYNYDSFSRLKSIYINEKNNITCKEEKIIEQYGCNIQHLFIELNGFEQTYETK